MERIKQELRNTLKDVERPDLYLAVIAGGAAWFITSAFRAIVVAICL
jgi:2-hydroxy-3-keto-5-methylthiopentenyl-1-phosphate phosphatase